MEAQIKACSCLPLVKYLMGDACKALGHDLNFLFSHSSLVICILLYLYVTVIPLLRHSFPMILQSLIFYTILNFGPGILIFNI